MSLDGGGETKTEVDGVADKPPRRWLAIVLAIVGPWGLGHYYAGRDRRAGAWLGGLFVGIFVSAAMLLVLAPFAAVWVTWLPMMMFALVSKLGPALDLLRLPLAKASPSLVRVVVFGVAALAVSAVAKDGVRGMLVEAFKIPSGGMAPTLERQDHLTVDKWWYGPPLPLLGRRVFANLPPERGDVVVFSGPFHPEADYVERVIAIGGDTLEVEAGHPVINGRKVPNCRVGRHTISREEDSGSGELFVEFLGRHAYLVFIEDIGAAGKIRQGPYRVPHGESWVLGDNRNNSADSRSFRQGQGAGVPDANLRGRARSLWLAFMPDASVDWERVGTNFDEPPRAPRNASPEVVAGLARCLAQRPTPTLPP